MSEHNQGAAGVESARQPPGNGMPAEPRCRPDAGRLRPRRTDRIQRATAWLLTALFLLALVAAVRSGVLHHAAALEQSRHDAAELSQVEAVLLAPPPMGTAGVQTAHPPVAAVPARYVDARGIPHVVPVTIRAQLSAGTRVPMWVDRDGLVAPGPSSGSSALVAAVVIGSTIAMWAGAALAAAWIALRHVLHRVNAARWARDWERLEPEWRARIHGP
jgi:hypothetical protein